MKNVLLLFLVFSLLSCNEHSMFMTDSQRSSINIDTDLLSRSLSSCDIDWEWSSTTLTTSNPCTDITISFNGLITECDCTIESVTFAFIQSSVNRPIVYLDQNLTGNTTYYENNVLQSDIVNIDINNLSNDNSFTFYGDRFWDSGTAYSLCISYEATCFGLDCEDCEADTECETVYIECL